MFIGMTSKGMKPCPLGVGNTAGGVVTTRERGVPYQGWGKEAWSPSPLDWRWGVSLLLGWVEDGR